MSAEVLHADVVYVQVIAGSDSTDAVENVFSALSAGTRVHHHIGVGQNAVHAGCDRVCDLFRALKRYIARQPDRKIREVAVTGSADAYAIDFQYALDFGNRIDDPVAHAGWSGIEKSVNGLTREPPAHIHHDSGNKQSGDGISVAQPVDAVIAPDQHQEQAQSDNSARPDIGGKMQSVCLQGLAVVFDSNFCQSSRAPVINAHRQEHHDKSRDAGLNLHMMIENPPHSLVDNPNTGEQQQARFHERGKVLHFTVAILVV